MESKTIEYLHVAGFGFNDNSLEWYLRGICNWILNCIYEERTDKESKERIEELIEYIELDKDIIIVKLKKQKYKRKDTQFILYIPIDINDSEMIKKIKKFKGKYFNSEGCVRKCIENTDS